MTMGEIQAVLESPNKVTIFLTVIAAFVAIQFLIKLYDWFVSRYGIQTKKSVREEQQQESINNMKTEMNQIKRDQESLMKSMKDLKSAMSDMQSKADAWERARLKDRIGQAYRYYNSIGKWNHMEKDAFDDLIESYEQAGGKNSFVHDVCLPRSMQWEIVE